MAARKKTKNKAKPHYVRSKKRKGAQSSVVARRVATIALLLLVVGGIFFAVYKGCEWIKGKLFSNNPRFEIHHLVISSNGNLGEDYIREISGLREGMNLFEFSFDQIVKKLTGVSQIESVYLERKLPHTLMVDVKERIPVARIVGARATRYPFLVDRYGYVMPHRRSAAALPLIKGLDQELPLGEQLKSQDVDKALEIIALCESSSYLHTYVRIESLDVKYSDFIDLRLQGGIRVRMPRYTPKPKLQNLATVIKIARDQGQRVKEVDLTLDSAKVPVTYY